MAILKRIFFKRRFSASERATIDFLRPTRFFSGMDAHVLASLHPYLHKRSYKPQEVVFFRQDPALALYILHTGSVQAFFPQADKPEPLQSFSPGDVFGYEALLPNKKRLFDAIATENTRLWAISHADLRALMAQDTRAAAQLLDRIAQCTQQSLENICQHYGEQVGFFQLKRALEV